MFDFKIQDNLIIERNKISAIFSVDPIDLLLISDSDKANVHLSLATALNSLTDSIQILVRTRNATSNDYVSHFRSLQYGENGDKQELINKYIKELKFILENNQITFKEYYLVVSVEGKIRTKKDLNRNTQLLNAKIQQFGYNLSKCNITLEHLTIEKGLESLIRSYIYT